LVVYKGDIRNKNPLDKIFSSFKVDAVIHLAGLKSVNDSIQEESNYYSNNVLGSKNLFKSMARANCKTIIFSSSATVYGSSKKMPLAEDSKISPINPYGKNKKDIESLLKDTFESDNSWRIAILRFFNPVGAHKSGLIGEILNEKPNNLMPYILKVASGELPHLLVFGDDYETHDGTGVRDYIHVEDIASGHVQAFLSILGKPQLIISNLGTGKGYSVLDVLKTFEKTTNQKIFFKISNRRYGDVSVSYSDPSFAKLEFDWEAKFNLEDMCKDAWNYKLKNMI
jgi:UDP-glucose 4-epimerase